jgi:mono/diheme cytochrome c family protein
MMRSLLIAMLGLVVAAPVTVGLTTAASAQQAVIAGGIVANGRALAMTWCANCHLVAPPTANTTAAGDVPTFASVARRLPTDADLLAAFIANPHPPMPNLNLSRQDIKDLLAYISTLR